MEPEFNPFETRRSRDIRNRMGSTMIESIGRGDLEPVRLALSALDIRKEEPKAAAYVGARCKRYERVLGKIQSQNILPNDVYRIAGLLWNEDLFFECHEWLEQNWQRVHGLEKEILQALIRSAGAFELLTYGKIKGAVQTASKALPVLTRNLEHIPRGLDILPQMDKLKRLLKNNPPQN